MKTLEVAPLKGKKLRVVLVSKAYDEPWSVTTPATRHPDSELTVIRRPSIAYCDMVRQVVEAEKPDFATDELGPRSVKEFRENNPLAEVFAKLKVPYQPVDMDEFARSHLSQAVETKLERRNEVLESLKSLSEEEATPAIKQKIEQLVAYGQYLQEELEEEVRRIQFGIRESWITMGIMKTADRLQKKRITAIHLSSPQHVKGLMELLQSLEVDVTSITPKQVLTETPKEPLRGMTALTGVSSVSVVPVVKRQEKKTSDILFFLEADDHASPFDICVAYDAGFDVVVPYPGVTAERIPELVQDAIFSRGTKGVKHTCFFVGGRNPDQSREMAKSIRKAMVRPFETAIVVDPHGAFSTSAAMVAKAEAALQHLELGPLKDARVLVLGGTGPVGESVAHLCATAGAATVITSRDASRAAAVAKRVSTKTNSVKGIQATTPTEIQSALADATLVFVTGAPGVQFVSLTQLEAINGIKILIDANAVPPSGVESLSPTDDVRELTADKFGIGALAVGDLKLKVQRQMLTDARRKAEGLFEDDAALTIGREALEQTLAVQGVSPLQVAK
jgi:methylene-tetrahydromethanopterin dehydrogenase